LPAPAFRFAAFRLSFSSLGIQLATHSFHQRDNTQYNTQPAAAKLLCRRRNRNSKATAALSELSPCLVREADALQTCLLDVELGTAIACQQRLDQRHVLRFHVTVSFRDNRHPAGVRFTSFVGDGRRSFAVQTGDYDLQEAIARSSEALCRIAIGQVVRDHLYDMASEGDYVPDSEASPWDGELRPVGTGNTAKPPRRR